MIPFSAVRIFWRSHCWRENLLGVFNGPRISSKYDFHKQLIHWTNLSWWQESPCSGFYSNWNNVLQKNNRKFLHYFLFSSNKYINIYWYFFVQCYCFLTVCHICNENNYLVRSKVTIIYTSFCKQWSVHNTISKENSNLFKFRIQLW